MYARAHIHTCTCVCVCVKMYARARTHTHTHTHVKHRRNLQGEDKRSGDALDAHDRERARERANQSIDDDIPLLDSVTQGEESQHHPCAHGWCPRTWNAGDWVFESGSRLTAGIRMQTLCVHARAFLDCAWHTHRSVYDYARAHT